MNRVFQVIWSHAAGMWVVVSELATRDGGRTSRLLDARAQLARHRLCAALLALLGPCSGAYAQSVHWDGLESTANADGGIGTWQNGAANWDSAATGGTAVAWNNGAWMDANFGGSSSGTVTIAAGGVSANDLNFTLNGYTLSGGTLTLGGSTTPTITTGAGTNTNLSSVIAGTLGWTKTGDGVLLIDGPTASVFDVVNVQQGLVHIGAAGGLTGVQQFTVGDGGMTVDGVIVGTAGADSFDIAGTVDGSGRIDLAAGDDVLVLRNVADTTGLLAPMDGGAGNDIIDAQVAAGTIALGDTVNFEALWKSGAGELAVQDAAFGATRIDEGTLAIAAGATFGSAATQVASGATLRVDGAFVGTAGDDTFLSAGSVIGALAFGAGDDTITFNGGNLAQMTGLDGGAGTDTVAFSGMALDDASVPSFANMETLALQQNASLRLAQALDLGGGALLIDGTSSLTASGSGARIVGDVRSAGALFAEANRIAITGDYEGLAGSSLHVRVSPGSGTGGGIDVDGNVAGQTTIVFDSDGSMATGATSIAIVNAPNATGGAEFTTARSSAGFVRLDGSLLDWTFEQQGAGWFLSTQADSVVPELPGYVVAPIVGLIGAGTSVRMVMDQLDRAPQCGRQDEKQDKANVAHFADCHGAWVAVSVDEVVVGADPGAAFSGDASHLIVGADIFGRGNQGDGFRGGFFAGLDRGNHWATGENSGPLQAGSGANVRSKTGNFGAYGTFAFANGVRIDATAVGQLHANDVTTPDGFSQKIVGESVTASVRAGKTFAPAPGWTLEPRLQIGGTASHWRDIVDAGGKTLALTDERLGTARADLRLERSFATAGGTHWRPWMTIGLEETFDEANQAVRLLDSAYAMPAHDLGLAADIDVGFEANAGSNVSYFAALSYGESLEGTSIEHREATVGLRLRW